MDFVLFPLVTGSILLLSAVGFSMIWRSENFLHIAHGQFLLIGAYLAYYFDVTLGLPFLLSAVTSVAATAAAGALLARLLFHPLRHAGALALLFTSIGLAYVIHGVVVSLGGVGVKGYDLPPTRALRMADMPLFTAYEMFVVLIALTAAAGLHLFLTRTNRGKAIRAVASDHRLATLRGVDTRRVSLTVWSIASGLAALAGVLLGVTGTIHPDMGWNQILMVLSAAVLGGLGSVYGVMAASYLIAVGMDWTALTLSPSYRVAAAFVVIILVLFVRPSGIFQRRTA